MNEFGGNWTKEKMDIFMKYVRVYLKIMDSQIKNKDYAKDWKLMYFDGFAGSGNIIQEEGETTNILEGVATQVLNIDNERNFDMYVFVESQEKNAQSLRENIKNNFPKELSNKSWVFNENFNDVSIRFADFLQKNKDYKCLAFIDPFGMNVKWSSIENLKGGISIDLWILVPTGLGANRLLRKDGQIEEGNLKKLSVFFGITEEEIKSYFYKLTTINTLFGEETIIEKEKKSVEKIHAFYKDRLSTIFEYVSDAFVMRNSTNSIMYHFLLASNNKTAQKIANDIVDFKKLNS